jgi:AraC family transcriptional regulator of adaptative response / DNA-3-methyladenine glycosylase II
MRDLAPAVERCRRLLDADCDTVAVDAALEEDSLLAPLVAQRPGMRVPGHVDGDELALRTVLGQQVSLAAANRLCALASALADGEVSLDRSADRATTREALLGRPGIGPWTADYVLMRALGDPDVFLPTDVAVRRVLGEHGEGRVDVERRAEGWRPWRAYALMHLLWATVLGDSPAATPHQRKDH